MITKQPLLDRISQGHRLQDLSDFTLIACQHILESQIGLVEALHRHKLPYERMYILGKCYSTSIEIANALCERGVQVHPLSGAYDPIRSFDEQFEQYVDQYVKETTIRDPNKTIVLDDGGYLLSHPALRNIRLGVEQTSAGYRRLRNLKVNHPIINVARSYAKLAVESPYIAKKCVQNLEELLGRQNFGPCLIIGAGAIGQSIYKELLMKGRPILYDRDSEKSQAVETLYDLIPYAEIIIGTTGEKNVLRNNWHRVHEGQVLASASSSDREFDAYRFRKQLSDCHETIKGRKNCKILNGGFPINFNGGPTSIPLENIQLTMTLLYAAIVNGLDVQNKGLTSLNHWTQHWILQQYAWLQPDKQYNLSPIK